MPVVAVVFLLIAAFTHAGWNYFAKSSRDTIAFLWWGVTIGAVGYGSFAIASGLGIYLERESWIPYGISIFGEIGYFLTLVRGYAKGDLSLVYPVSRGSAPLFVTLWSALVMGERLPVVGYVGIALMIVGVYVASLTGNGAGNELNFKMLLTPFRNHAAQWALACGVFIAIYSLSDRVVISATPPLVYNFWVYAGNCIFWLPFVWSRARVQQNLDELKTNWLCLIIASAFVVSTYVFVLLAQTMTSTSYVSAGRGLSVVVGALLGTVVLKEGFGKVRMFSAALMVIGLALVAFG